MERLEARVTETREGRSSLPQTLIQVADGRPMGEEVRPRVGGDPTPGWEEVRRKVGVPTHTHFVKTRHDPRPSSGLSGRSDGTGTVETYGGSEDPGVVGVYAGTSPHTRRRGHLVREVRVGLPRNTEGRQLLDFSSRDLSSSVSGEPRPRGLGWGRVCPSGLGLVRRLGVQRKCGSVLGA